MRVLRDMLKPRASVFADNVRDDTLNLSDFADGKTDGRAFFAETFRTQGMNMLFDAAFTRLEGTGDAGVIKLTQAMGGGKTSCMIATALLAKDTLLRHEILGGKFDGIGDIKVVTFSGRENAEYGIWGEIAQQLGCKEMFSPYYSPLQAPGERAWLNLLGTGEPILILLDELPPYLENAKSMAIGNSDLCKVTIAALANLFSAMGKEKLSHVCLVFSDLNAAYESSSELLQSSFKELEKEANRLAMEISPVQLNSDEVYSILRKRLFEDKYLCSAPILEKSEIAAAFREAVVAAKKQDFTNYSPELCYEGVKDCYPFHPSIKDIYARFKDNQNFQQTRGLIKMMRQVVRSFYESGRADKEYLINVYDVDLNSPPMLSQVHRVKDSLIQAIAHDVAQEGKSIAEDIDRREGGDYAQRISKMILMSSLSTAIHAELGLSRSDIVGYIAGPNVDLSKVISRLTDLQKDCWYLKTDSRGRNFFQNTKNLNAEMLSMVNNCSFETAKKELQKRLSEMFKPTEKTCYQKILVFPALDEIHLDAQNVTLVIIEPYSGQLNPEAQRFYEEQNFKNRILFLTGESKMMDALYERAKKLQALDTILNDRKREPLTDQQTIEAEAKLDSERTSLYSATQQAFVSLYYPDKNGLRKWQIAFQFVGNEFNGEEQIVQALSARKFNALTNEAEKLGTIQTRVERDLFTAKEMRWQDILARAAEQPGFVWYAPDQLEILKRHCLNRDLWREKDGYLQKGPFELEPTSVSVTQVAYNEQDGTFVLRIIADGGTVFYDCGATPTELSTRVDEKERTITVDEPNLIFACIDETGKRKQGPAVEFVGRPTLRYDLRTSSDGRQYVTLHCRKGYTIRYTTDGSEPEANGGIYEGEFEVPAGCQFVLAVSLFKDKKLDTLTIRVSEARRKAEMISVKEDKPLSYRFKRQVDCGTTEDSYAFLQQAKNTPNMSICDVGITFTDKEHDDKFIDIDTSAIRYEPAKLLTIIDTLRDQSFDVGGAKVRLKFGSLFFENGADFNTWIEQNKYDMTKVEAEGVISQ